MIYDIPLRWAAWVKHKMNPDLFRPGSKLPFTYNGHCRPLVKPSTADWIVKVVLEEQAYFQNEFGVDLVLIGIDTLTAAAGWLESESSAAEGQMIMNNLDAVSSACKNFVMTADHFGKDESAEARGTSVKITSPPTLLYMKGGAKQSITLRKSRSGPQGLEFPFEMKTVDMGTDRFGAPKTSLVVDWNVTRTVTQRASGSRSIFDQALTETFRNRMESITVDGVGAVDAVREFHLRGAFKRLYKAHKQEEAPERDVTSHAISAAWNRAVEKALERTLKMTPGPGGAGFLYHPPPI